MFKIYKRVPQSSVLSWSWFFDQLRFLGRALRIIGPDAISEGSLSKGNFVEGFWLNVDGSRVYGFSAGLSGSNLHQPDFGGGGMHNSKGSRVNYVTHGIRLSRVNIYVDVPSHFILQYAVGLDLEHQNPYEPNAARQRGTYSTIHVDGTIVDAGTDYTLNNEWGGLVTWQGTFFDQAHRLCGYAIVLMPSGRHNVELMIHGRVLSRVRNIEVSIAEVH